MLGLSLFHTAFERKGYHIYSSPINKMEYAVAPRAENNHLCVVVFINNKTKDFASSLEFSTYEEIIRNSNHVPNKGVKLVFLYLIWDYGKNKDFKGKNIIYVDSETNTAYPRKLSIYSKEAVNIIDTVLCYDTAHASLNATKFGAVVETHTPWMAGVLVALNILIYMFTRSCAAKYGYSPSGILEGSVLGIFTYMFVHANLSHLIGNMVSLYCIGSALEEYIGAAKMICLYIVSGISGALVDLLISVLKQSETIAQTGSYSSVSSVVTVGASGAICGLLTAFIVKVLMTPKKQRLYNVNSLLRSVVMILFSGMLVKNVNNLAHIGGMVSGATFMVIFCMADRLDYYKKKIQDTQMMAKTEQLLYKRG